MIFDRNNEKQVVALLGAGSMGTAIVRRIGAGKKIFLGDISEKARERVSEDFGHCGYDVETMVVNALHRDSIEAFVDLDMVGTGLAIDAFGGVMAAGGSGLIISSQAAYMYPIPNDIELQLVNTPTEGLKDVPFVKEVAMQNSGLAYMIAKRINHLQAQRAAATSWRKRRARINTISPGVIVTPLAYDEFNANGEGYQRMIDASAAGRTGTSDEIAEAAAFLLGEHARFITGTDLLIDGGVIAAIRTGEYKLGE